MEPELTRVGAVLNPTDREEETRLPTIIVFKCHIGIPIGTYASLKLVDRTRELIRLPILILESQYLLLWKCCVARLVRLDFVTLHQVSGIEVRSYLDSTPELERISAGEDVEKLVILVEIH